MLKKLHKMLAGSVREVALTALSAFFEALLLLNKSETGNTEDSNDSLSFHNTQLGEYYLNLWIFI